MAHSITALIGTEQALSKISSQLGAPESTMLSEGLVILPLSEGRKSHLAPHASTESSGVGSLSSELASAIAELLHGAQALYLETEYFGGSGAQAAAFFDGGKVIWAEATSDFDGARKPSFLESVASIFKEAPVTPDPAKSPISKGLSMLGVKARGDMDEFDAVGLGRFRSLASLGIEQD